MSATNTSTACPISSQQLRQDLDILAQEMEAAGDPVATANARLRQAALDAERHQQLMDEITVESRRFLIQRMSVGVKAGGRAV